jgi:hypothetical protein
VELCDFRGELGITPPPRSALQWHRCVAIAFFGGFLVKFTRWILLLALLGAASAQAAYDTGLDCRHRNEVANTITDVIIIRPVGFAATLAGGALFVGLSPLTALASMPAPHDAFPKLAAILVGAPFSYTFERPLGYFETNCE